MFPSFDNRPIAPVFHVDFQAKKLVYKETVTRFICEKNVIYKKVA
jgi:hypothetical protein